MPQRGAAPSIKPPSAPNRGAFAPSSYDEAVKAGGIPMTLDEALARGGSEGGDIPTSQPSAPTPPTPWTDYLPSPRTMLRVGGGAIGGVVGGAAGLGATAPTIAGAPMGAVGGAMIGGGAGASIGESIWQLWQHATGSSEAPKSGNDAAMGQAGAITQGALQEGAPAAIGRLLPPTLRAGAASNIEQAVRPAGMAVKEAVQDAAPKAVGKLPVARSAATLRTSLDKLSNTANIAVNNAYSAVTRQFPNMRFNSAPLIAKLQSELDTSSVQGATIVGQESKAKAYQSVIDWLQKHPRFDLNEFRKVKQNWDEVINWNKYSDAAAKDPVMAEALERAVNAVRGTIHATFPSLAKVDQDASMWITLRKAAKAADIREAAAEPIKALISRYGLASSIGAGAEYARGGNPVVGAVVGATLAKLPQTVLWDTMNASTKAQLARLIESKLGAGALQGLSLAVSAGAPAAMKAFKPKLSTATDYLREKNRPKE